MSVTPCAIPAGSRLGGDGLERASFTDAWTTPLARPAIGVTAIFLGIFAHRPWWLKALLLARNQAGAWGGLAASTPAEVLRPERREHYAVGERIAGWPIFALDDSELIAGRDNPHLDFRVSVLKRLEGEASSVVISTVCTAHNRFGERYLAVIAPFHRRGIRKLIATAVAAGRL